MATNLVHNEKNCFYFVTFTCYKWMPLLNTSNIYDYLKIWTNNLSERGFDICGYVIMPNHIHLLVFIHNENKGLNITLSEAKRFLAYEIIKRLKKLNEMKLLDILSGAVSDIDKSKKQRHVVFKKSFDAKIIRGEEEINKILDYIHHNPVSKKWNLVKDYLVFPYSSARYYEIGDASYLNMVDYREILRVFCE